MMCDNCKKTLGKCVKSHDINSCPLKKGSYCCLCACYGHSVRKCTKDTTYRSPEFLEQLIPTSLLEEYGINTNTKLVSTREPVIKNKVVLDYVDEPKAIRSLLKAYGNLPKKEERDKNKYKSHIQKFAKKNNLIIVPHLLEKNEDIKLDE
jgi:hypothetical protein